MSNQEKGWREEFYEKFVKQGIPIGIRKYENKDGTDITPSKLEDFISSVESSAIRRTIERAREISKEKKYVEKFVSTPHSSGYNAACDDISQSLEALNTEGK